MQSKAAFVLLGLLKERPMNPYEIIKILDKLNISQWSPIATSSVYATIHVLEKKDYIVGERLKTSAMPEKTVYSVTTAGQNAFIKALNDYITNGIHLATVKLMIEQVERTSAWDHFLTGDLV